MNEYLATFGSIPAVGSKRFWKDLEEDDVDPYIESAPPPILAIEMLQLTAKDSAYNPKFLLKGGLPTAPQVISGLSSDEVSGYVRGAYAISIYPSNYPSHLTNYAPVFVEMSNPSVKNPGVYFVGLQERKGVKASPNSTSFELKNTLGKIQNTYVGIAAEQTPNNDAQHLSGDNFVASATSPILSALSNEYQNAEVIESERERANLAVGDAKQFAQKHFADTLPEVSISDDGIVSYSWRGQNEGVLLSFFGDNTVAVSLKGPAKSYGMNYEIIDLSDSLPEEALKVIAAIERTAR